MSTITKFIAETISVSIGGRRSFVAQSENLNTVGYEAKSDFGQNTLDIQAN
jgi:hypothetical protein